MLEHVVPALVITEMIRVLARRATTTPDEIARVLRELSTQVVVTRDEDRLLPRGISDEAKAQLQQHFIGQALEPSSFQALKWARYLEARERIGFGVEDFVTIPADARVGENTPLVLEEG